VALAIMEKMRPEHQVEVHYHDLNFHEFFDREVFTLQTPPILQDWLYDYDNLRSVGPFSFRLELPPALEDFFYWMT
jgi:hypothetical protein